ncbi:hypothetical protein BTO05_02375 [Winogradskyella sp. PC-19]|uniref:patatin-like phospholipase family protein n=1 Tax=unclassified Winogradskyella TaxID=2615021 RepID=UPI000B3C8AA6|nr:MULTISPECIES: patatin-like phospholipase family protein [unclassified Winogradskyella]ARV08541.1 hypothetical protein BTO05_02375 [Winogradskyella sp. PC-19]
METTDKFQPFNNIGLCFSGGGYRATFFALGIVSYLDNIAYDGQSLLSKVKALSSVSGGTLLAVAYAKAVQADDYNFKTFFKTFYNTFTPDNDKLLETAISKLEDDAVWENTTKKRSLINAFALTYAEMPVFSGSFEYFEESKIKQLEQVCFNATDFSFGLTYRFQNSGDFGNKPLNNSVVKDLSHQIKLGDVIASSSCFPVGFEPLVFPDDYFENHQSVDYKNLKGLERFIDGVGIMDGGIADNQGIGSMMLIDNRLTRKDKGLDLIMVNDVGSYKMKPWQQDTNAIGKNSTVKNLINKALQYFTIKPLYWILLLIGLLLLVLNDIDLIWSKSYTSLNIIGGAIFGVGLLLTVFGLVASVIKTSVLGRIKRLFKKNVPEPLLDDILTFQKLDISLVQRMLTDRLTSAMTMINDVFLKQMRRLNYDLFYSKSSLNNRRITTTVYKLNGQETPYSKNTTNSKIPKASKSLESVCLTASETPTTLWWDKTDIAKNRMETLIACGQFTACYELMDYILELKKGENSIIEDFTEIDKLYKTLKKDWKAFNDKPLWLVDELK